MLYMAVDFDTTELKEIENIIKEIHPDDEIRLFEDPLLAFQYAFQNIVDVAYVSAQLKRISGFELAKMLQTTKGNPQVVLIDHDDVGREDALRIGADGYVIRPVTVEKMLHGESMEW